MRLLPGMRVIGVYWDDINQLLFIKKLVKRDDDEHLDIIQDTLANLPIWGSLYKKKPITFDSLTLPENLVAILFNIANIMRSHSVNDEHLRYKETVKLLLARYCDEREAARTSTKELQLQVYEGSDPQFMSRVERLYRTASQRYSRATTLFNPIAGPEISERTLRDIVKSIQGINFTSASNETMQQVFMSFVPAVFKKNLDQYFTPISLIETMVDMVYIGPNDKIADPGMGTADFLTAAMEYRSKQGDDDIIQRVFGIDSDPKAYDLAVVNMILNRDGQSNLLNEDSIENYSRWENEMNIVLCNPPFGERSIESRPQVLKHYDLGHRWIFDQDARKWVKTDEILPSQQLGIMFIERSFKLLADEGRLAIILPEGYLCTPIYGYVRQWLLQNLRILSLTELPRRIFTKSDADLRSNILIAQKLSKQILDELIQIGYHIHAELVRKVGFKMGKGFQPQVMRDPATGAEIRDDGNKTQPDSDFVKVCEGFKRFTSEFQWNQTRQNHAALTSWRGARVSNITDHPNLDMKPRRLMPRALENIRTIKANNHLKLEAIAEVVENTIDIIEEYGISKLWKLVEGQDLRAIEGTIIPEYPSRAWAIAERKGRRAYLLRHKDIIVGLVRPERRNIGMLLNSDNDIIGIPDGIAVVRVKPEYQQQYPQEWLFATLRSEACRLQFWTESGGTSYGKLTRDHILNVSLPIPDFEQISVQSEQVEKWALAIEQSLELWEDIGTDEDRMPIVNSAIYGLESNDE